MNISRGFWGPLDFQPKSIVSTHVGTVGIPPIYGDDWGIVDYGFKF